jgi:hypothetical protein
MGSFSFHIKKIVSVINLTGSLGSFIPSFKTETKIRLRIGLPGTVSKLSEH